MGARATRSQVVLSVMITDVARESKPLAGSLLVDFRSNRCRNCGEKGPDRTVDESRAGQDGETFRNDRAGCEVLVPTKTDEAPVGLHFSGENQPQFAFRIGSQVVGHT